MTSSGLGQTKSAVFSCASASHGVLLAQHKFTNKIKLRCSICYIPYNPYYGRTVHLTVIGSSLEDYGTTFPTVLTPSAAAAAGSQKEGGRDTRIASADAILELEAPCFSSLSFLLRRLTVAITSVAVSREPRTEPHASRRCHRLRVPYRFVRFSVPCSLFTFTFRATPAHMEPRYMEVTEGDTTYRIAKTVRGLTITRKVEG